MKFSSIYFIIIGCLFNFSFSQNFEVKTKGKNLEIIFTLEETNFDFVTINGEEFIDFSKKFDVKKSDISTDYNQKISGNIRNVPKR